jgi:hypothetical protein
MHARLRLPTIGTRLMGIPTTPFASKEGSFLLVG